MRTFLASLALCALVVPLGSCTKTTPPARAFKIQSRADLIGGKRALAEVGDYKITNGLVHAIIQDVGTSRGFGAFGGSLIDVDLVRGNAASSATGTAGNDYFTEMFPAFFLQAIEPAKVDVLSDGSEGGAASVRVSGRGGVFVSLVKPLTDLVIPKQVLDYTCDYSVEPGKQYVKIVVTLTNPGPNPAEFPITIPFGFVTLLGEGQKLFVPGGAGFDMRFYLEDVVYKKKGAQLTALPGTVTPMFATAGDGVSYALAPGRQAEGSYLANTPGFYTDATQDSMLIPIASSSFLGTFWAKSPQALPPKASMSYVAYLAVGSGDVASAQKVVYELDDSLTRSNGKTFRLREPVAHGTLSGVVSETPTNQRVGGVSVVLQNEKGEWVSQAQTNADGTWTAPVPPGRYVAYAVDRNRQVAKSAEAVGVEAGGQGRVDLKIAQQGQLQVMVRDGLGRMLPAKVSVEGIYDHSGDEPPRAFLYNLPVGEAYRVSDIVPDDAADPKTRRYMEQILFAPHGTAGAAIRPGKYTVYASRGVEYDLASQEVEIAPGKTTIVALELHEVMPTPGWISGDFHVHSQHSVDSNMSLTDRVISYAVEGVDFLSSTDHNYVTDLQPSIDGLKLSDFVRSSVGLELTSLEMGHFNAFPLVVQPGPVTHGSFRWFLRPPGELFAQLRGLGKDPQNTIVQVNHPRDSILGYFNAFNIGTYRGEPVKPLSSFGLDTSPLPDGTKSPYDPTNFSDDFDVLEVMNGKRADILFSYRVPTTPIPGDEPNLPRCDGVTLPAFEKDCLPAPGEIIQRVTKFTKNGQTEEVKQPAFPGALDDWFTFLKYGKHVTATGNSDSHSAGAEAGLPRTYLQVGATADGSMRGLSENAAYAAMREGRAVVTNGPFLDVTVNGKGLGQTVVASDGKVDVKLTVKAAPWMDVTRVVVRRGGPDLESPEVLETIPVPATSEVTRLEVTKSYVVPDRSFIVVEAFGEKPMWPVFTPHEVPSLQISDAVGVIGSSFGYGNKFGKYEPELVEQVTPYGFTNPIWVDRVARQSIVAPKRVLPVSNSEPYTPRTMPDLRRLFGAFHSDPD